DNLGKALLRKGLVDRAITAHRRAVELSPKSPTNHINLGNTLRAASDWAGAVAAYREALQLKPNHAEAHCYLGLALQEQGLFSEAWTAIQRGDRLSSTSPTKTYSTRWLKQVQRYVALDAKLPGILNRSEKPA